MTKERVGGLSAVVLGVFLLIYMLSGAMHFTATSGIGAIGPFQICPGTLFIVGGLIALILGKRKLP